MAHFHYSLSQFPSRIPPPSSFIPPPQLFPQLYEDTPHHSTPEQDQNLEGIPLIHYDDQKDWPRYMEFGGTMADFGEQGVSEQSTEQDKGAGKLPLSEIKTKEEKAMKELQARNVLVKEGARMKEQRPPQKRKMKKRKYLKRIGA